MNKKFLEEAIQMGKVLERFDDVQGWIDFNRHNSVYKTKFRYVLEGFLGDVSVFSQSFINPFEIKGDCVHITQLCSSKKALGILFNLIPVKRGSYSWGDISFVVTLIDSQGDEMDKWDFGKCELCMESQSTDVGIQYYKWKIQYKSLIKYSMREQI